MVGDFSLWTILLILVLVSACVGIVVGLVHQFTHFFSTVTGTIPANCGCCGQAYQGSEGYPLSHIISAAPPINSTTIAEAAPIKIAAQGIIC